MKIYTKTGDKGETSLFGGKRVSKYSARIFAYGTVDELNAHLGIVRSLDITRETGQILKELQHQMFVLGGVLAAPEKKYSASRIRHEHVQRIEEYIDKIQEKLPELHSFILPAGTGAAAMLHVSRTVARRAERWIVALARKEEVGEVVLQYINRVSDLLFVLARYENVQNGRTEEIWMPATPL